MAFIFGKVRSTGHVWLKVKNIQCLSDAPRNTLGLRTVRLANIYICMILIRYLLDEFGGGKS